MRIEKENRITTAGEIIKREKILGNEYFVKKHIDNDWGHSRVQNIFKLS